LTQTPAAPKTEPSAQTSRPTELPAQNPDEVRQNVLDALIDRSKRGNADTLPSRRPPKPGDKNHA
jgi:hypothetical protein